MIDGVIDGVIGFKDWNVFHNILKTFDNLMIMGINVRNNDKKDKVIFEGMNQGHTVVCKVVVDMEQLDYFRVDGGNYIPIKKDPIVVQYINACIKHDMLKRICFYTRDSEKYIQLYCDNGYLNELIDDNEERFNTGIYDNLKNKRYVKSKLRKSEVGKICDILSEYGGSYLKISYDVECGFKLKFSLNGDEASFLVDAVNTNKSVSNHVLVYIHYINSIMKNVTSEYVTFYINKDDILFVKTSKSNGVKYVFSIAPVILDDD